MVRATIERKRLCDGTTKLPNLVGPIVLVLVVVLVLERAYQEVTSSRKSGQLFRYLSAKSTSLHQKSFEDEDDDDDEYD
jgi:hypothetical protein